MSCSTAAHVRRTYQAQKGFPVNPQSSISADNVASDTLPPGKVSLVTLCGRRNDGHRVPRRTLGAFRRFPEGYRVSAADIQNWLSIYIATAICCGFAITLTTLSLGADMVRERFWSMPWSLRRIIFFAPRTWWRWQRRYFLSVPVTLGIVGSFAASLNWG